MSKKRAVVSLGHEALGYTTLEQWDAVKVTAKALADLVEADYQLTITHSNGPQVSMIHKAMTELRRVYIDYTPAPMCVCSAMSQGYVGYDIQNSLRSELLSRGISKPVSTILTQVTVDPYDEAFYEPTKRIGRYMSREDAEIEIKKGNYVVEEPGRGFRRVVAAPKPIDIVEIESIKTLADADQVVIACGGGGIPVIEQQHALKGASAVIEKDCIAGKLAADLSADCLIILTGVDYVYRDYTSEKPTPIEHMTAAEAKELIAQGQFEEGTMLPKIEAAVAYLEKVPQGSVLITSLAQVKDAVRGKDGHTHHRLRCAGGFNRLFQYRKIGFKGFPAAFRIFDANTGSKETCEGKAHGESVIVMGFYVGGMGRARIDHDKVLSLVAADSHGGEIFRNGADPVTLLIADVPDAGNGHGTVSKGSDGGKGDGLIRAGGQIRRDAVQPSTGA